jgi:hypothetical protein
MNKQQVISLATLAGNQEYTVLYHKAKDMVELKVGGTSLRLAATTFFMMNEMMRKAAAKLVMQTELQHILRVESALISDLRVPDKKPAGAIVSLKSLQHV